MVSDCVSEVSTRKLDQHLRFIFFFEISTSESLNIDISRSGLLNATSNYHHPSLFIIIHSLHFVKGTVNDVKMTNDKNL